MARNWLAQLIIVAAHGKGAWERTLWGSVSEALLEHAMVPVIVAKQGQLYEQQHAINILVALDNSPFSIQAAERFLQSNWSKPVNIKLMTVVPPLTEKFSTEENTKKAEDMLLEQQQIQNDCMSNLQMWERHIREYIQPVKLEYQICQGVPHDEILAEAKRWPANLIVMGSHGYTGLKRIAMGSVARGVSHNANCSVEIVRIPSFEQYYHHWEMAAKKTDPVDIRSHGDHDMPKYDPNLVGNDEQTSPFAHGCDGSLSFYHQLG